MCIMCVRDRMDELKDLARNAGEFLGKPVGKKLPNRFSRGERRFNGGLTGVLGFGWADGLHLVQMPLNILHMEAEEQLQALKYWDSLGTAGWEILLESRLL